MNGSFRTRMMMMPVAAIFGVVACGSPAAPDQATTAAMSSSIPSSSTAAKPISPSSSIAPGVGLSNDFTADDAALITKLSPAVAAGCKHSQPKLPGQLAAVLCFNKSDNAGGVFASFSDENALVAQWPAFLDKGAAHNCDDGPDRDGAYTPPGRQQSVGRYSCGTMLNSPTVFYYDTSAKILGAVQATTVAEAIAWWKANGAFK